jgi:hypothetical protein
MTQLEHLAWSHTTLSLVAQTPSPKLSEWCENRNDKLKLEELKEDSLGVHFVSYSGGDQRSWQIIDHQASKRP